MNKNKQRNDKKRFMNSLKLTFKCLLLIFLFFFLATGVLAYFCPRCGTKIPDNNKFCFNCGLPMTPIIQFIALTEEKEKTLLSKFSNPLNPSLDKSVAAEEEKNINSSLYSRQNKIKSTDLNEKMTWSNSDSRLKKRYAPVSRNTDYATKKAVALRAPSKKAETLINSVSKKEYAPRSSENALLKPEFKRINYKTEPDPKEIEQEQKEKAMDFHQRLALSESASGFKSMENKPSNSNAETQIKPEETVINQTAGLLKIFMAYDKKGGVLKNKTPGKVYLNSSYIGEIKIVENQPKKSGYGSNLFGKLSAKSDKVNYKFTRNNIPPGVYQIKIIMRNKGFLRNVSRYKVFKDVVIEAGKVTNLSYEWDSKTSFGK